MNHFECINFADYITEHGIGARVSGKTVRAVFGSPTKLGDAWRVLSGLPEQESTLDAFNRYLAEHSYVAGYDGPNDAFVLNRLQPQG